MFHAKVKLVTLFFARQRKDDSALAGVQPAGAFFCSVYSGLVPTARLIVCPLGIVAIRCPSKTMVVLSNVPRASLRSAFLISSPTMLFIECPF